MKVSLTNETPIITGGVPETPREVWKEAFREMSRRGDDVLDPELSGPLTSFDEEEWDWS